MTDLEVAARVVLEYLDEMSPGYSRSVGRLPSLSDMRRALRVALEGKTK